MIVCPNKNTAEYIELSVIFGEALTQLLFEENNYELPSMTKAIQMVANFEENDGGNIITFNLKETNPIFTSEAFEMVKEFIPDIQPDEMVIVANLINGKKGGKFRKGIISLYTNDKSIDAQIIKHEVFHKLWNQYIPEKTKQAVLTSLDTFPVYKAYAKNRENSILVKEEFLAEQFQKYTNNDTGVLTTLKQWFEKLKNILYRIVGINRKLNKDIVEGLFKNIYNHNYNTRLIENNQVEDISKYIKDLQIYFPSDTKADAIIRYYTAKLYIKSSLANQLRLGKTVVSAAKEIKLGIALHADALDLLKLYEEQEGDFESEIEYINSLSDEYKTVYYLAKDNSKVVEIIVSDMFPSFRVGDVKTYEELLEKYEEATNVSGVIDEALYSEMLASFNVNYETKLSQIVKQYLKLIPIPDDKLNETGVTRYIDEGLAFVLTLKLLEKINLNQNLANIGTDLDSIILHTKTNKYERAVAQVIKELTENAATKAKVMGTYLENLSFEFPSDAVFVKYKGKEMFLRNSKNEPVVIHDNYDDLALNIYAEIIENDPTVAEEISKYGGEFILEEIIRYLQQRKNTNILAQLNSELGSLVNNNPIVMITAATKKAGEKLTYMYKVTEISPGGVASAMRQNITTFISMLTGSGIFTYESMINALGIIDVLNDAQKIQAKEIIKDINAKTRIQKEAEKNKETTQASDSESTLEISKSDIKDLADLFAQNDDMVQAQNYFDARNNRRYVWGMGAWLHDAYKLILNKEYRHPFSALAGKTPLLKISNIKTLDSYTLTTNKEQTHQVRYQNFKVKDFITAHFLGGFISVLSRQHKIPKYYQALYTQSNRPTDDFVEVTFSDETKLRQIADLNRKEYEFTKISMQIIKTLAAKDFNELTADEKAFYKIYAKKNFTSTDDLFLADNDTLFVELETQAELAFIEFIKIFPNHKASAVQISNVVKMLGKFSQTTIETAERFANIVADNGVPYTEYGNLYLAFNLFYKNNYIAGHQVNAHFFGNIALTTNSVDLIKRMQGVKSPGKKQLTNDIGVRKTVRALTAADNTVTKDTVDDLRNIYSKIIGMKVERTDAVTFGTPSTLKLLQEGTGDYGLSNIVKTVMFYIDPYGIPHYNKTALFIITDNLAARYPELAKIRELMETEDIQYYTYASAYKVGQPLAKDLMQGVSGNIEANVTEWDNSAIRIQSNPKHDEGAVSNPAQFNYFLNQSIDENGNTVNEVDAHNAYAIDYALMNNKLEQLKLVTGIIDSKGKVDKAKIKAFLLASLTDRDYELLNDGVSMDYPYLVKTLIIQLSNHITKNTVKIKHSGNKLINQSDLGITIFNNGTYEDLTNDEKLKADAFFDLDSDTKEKLINYKTIIDGIPADKDILTVNKMFLDKWRSDKFGQAEFDDLLNLFNNENILVPRPLLMRDKDNFTEVIAPAWWKEKGIKLGSHAVYDELIKQGFAIRIPTTGIHSGLAIKIVGFSDDINGIIVPSEVIAIHGSDFDVDSLYFIHREIAEKTEKIKITLDVEYHEMLADRLKTILAAKDDNNVAMKALYAALQANGEAIKQEIADIKNQSEISSSEIQAEFLEYISTPNYSPMLGKDIVRKDIKGFDIERSKSEFAAFNDYNYNTKTKEFSESITSEFLLELYEYQVKTLSQFKLGEDVVADTIAILRQITIETNANLFIIPKGTIIGYKKDGTWDTEFDIKLNDYITKFSVPIIGTNELETKQEQLRKNVLIKLLQLNEKLLKNKKFNIYLNVLTKPETQSDVNTPITFDAVKADIEMLNARKLSTTIENSILNELNNEENLIDIWNNDTALQSIISLEDFVATKYTIDDVIASIEINEYDNTIIITNEYVKKALLNSKLGVKGKLQIATGKFKEANRNPNNFLHQIQIHKDNFEGVSGTGIQANIMKVISYLMQGSELIVNGKSITIEDIVTMIDEEITVEEQLPEILNTFNNNEAKITELRQQEQVELKKAFPNVEGKITKEKLNLINSPIETLAKFDEIYDRFDAEITALLNAQQKEQSISSLTGEQIQNTEELKSNDILLDIIEKLNQTGLSNEVVLLSNSEINEKLKELGIDDVTMTTTGFVHNSTKTIYLNTDNPNIVNTTMHTHGHLYLNYLKENKLELYQSGLAKTKTAEAQPYINYVKETQPNLIEGTEAFQNEVLAQVIGDMGAKLVNSKKQDGLAQWLSDVWTEIKNMLGLSKYTNEQVQNMTLQQYADAINVDLLSGKKINDLFNSLLQELAIVNPAFEGIQLTETPQEPTPQTRVVTPFTIERDRRRDIFKVFGERTADAILSKLSGAMQNEPEQLIAFLKEFVPIKATMADVINANGGYLQKMFEKSIGETEETSKKSTLRPEDLLNKVGYSFDVKDNLQDAQKTYKSYYKDGEVICTLNVGSNRFNESYVAFFVRDDARETPHANDLTQENITERWAIYLESQGRKNADGTFNLKNLRLDRLDPYSTSVMSVQISKSASTLKSVSRYNHKLTVNPDGSVVDPDQTYKNLDNIVEELHDSFYNFFDVVQPTGSKLDIANGYILNDEGHLFKRNGEREGVVFGEGYYIKSNGETVILDPATQRMGDSFLFDIKSQQVIDVTNGKVFTIGENQGYNKIQFTNKNTIKLTGEFETEIEIKDGNLFKLKSNVTTIDDEFLYFNNTLTEVDLLNNTTIGDRFLYSNKILTKLNLPNNTTIGIKFLQNNEALTELSLPNNTTIGDNFLHDNEILTKLDLQNNITIGANFLYNNKELTKLSLPNNTTIGNDFLVHNEILTELNLPNNTTIGNEFLYKNKVLTELYLPNNTFIGSHFLYLNNVLTELSLPNNTTIGDKFLYFNKILTKLSLPNNTTIGDSFLFFNNTLTELSLPNNTTIGDSFLFFNKALTELNLPNNTTIGYKFLYFNKVLTELSLPNNTTIGDNFLHDNETLTETSSRAGKKLTDSEFKELYDKAVKHGKEINNKKVTFQKVKSLSTEQSENISGVLDNVPLQETIAESKEFVANQTQNKNVVAIPVTNTKSKKQTIVTLKDGTEGVLERSRVTLKKLDFVIDGHNYNTLERISMDGEKTTETSDTVLNGYVDNVKELITTIINANKETIGKIGLMIYMGIPLDIITYMLNQESVKKLANLSYNKQQELKASYASQYDSEYLLTKQDLIDNLINPTSKVQAKVMTMLSSLNKYDDEISELATQLSMLKSMPINELDIMNAMEKTKINNFISPNFYQVQNIKGATDALKALDKILTETFILSSSENRKYIKGMASDIAFDEKNLANSYNTVKSELESFLLANWIETLKRTGEIKETNFVGVDIQGNLVEKKPNVSLTREEIWIQEFIKSIEEAKKTTKSKFLQLFAVKLSRKNVKYLIYNAGTSLKDDRLLEIMKGYLTLPSELKRKFVIYSVLKDGARFGFKGFTSMLSNKNTSEAVRDGLEDVVKVFDETLQGFDAKVKHNMEELFLEQFISSHLELLEAADVTALQADKYPIIQDYIDEHGDTNTIFTDKVTLSKYIKLGRYFYKRIATLTYDYESSSKIINPIYVYLAISGDREIDTYSYFSEYETSKYNMTTIISDGIQQELNKLENKKDEYKATYTSIYNLKPMETIKHATVNGKIEKVKLTRVITKKTIINTADQTKTTINAEQESFTRPLTLSEKTKLGDKLNSGKKFYKVETKDIYKIEDVIDEQINSCSLKK